MTRARLIADMFTHGATELAAMFKSHDENMTTKQALDALTAAVNRPQPAPVVNLPVPIVNLPAPVVHIAAPEAPVVNVTVPEQPRRPRRVRVEYDEHGNKRRRRRRLTPSTAPTTSANGRTAGPNIEGKPKGCHSRSPTPSRSAASPRSSGRRKAIGRRAPRNRARAAQFSAAWAVDRTIDWSIRDDEFFSRDPS
jgi:hypothetical protein